MLASKSWVGHAEPAAGLVGLLFAQQAAFNHLALPVMHLASVNPYVASTLDQSPHAAVLLPKQASATAQGPASLQPFGSILGISAFAFMGTNAHALVSSSSSGFGESTLQSQTPLPWRMKRHFVLPEANLLLGAALALRQVQPGQRQVSLQADLAAAQLAFLWSHQVLGKAIFPGALFQHL